MVSSIVVILNQLLDVVCIGTAMEVGGIGSMKLGMGNILSFKRPMIIVSWQV